MIPEIKTVRLPGTLGKTLDTIQRSLNAVIRLLNTTANTKRSFVGPWISSNIAVSTNTKMSLGVGNSDFTPNRGGFITGLIAKLNEVAAGSTLKVEVRDQYGTILHVGEIQTGDSFFTSSGLKIQMTAEEPIEVYVVSDGSWTATTADLAVFLEIETL